jgi:hypothetical protein
MAEGEIENAVQGGMGVAAWVTGRMLPAMVALDDRCCVPVFCVQETVAVPEPFPLAGVALSQEPLPDAVQPPPTQLTGDTPVTVTS